MWPLCLSLLLPATSQDQPVQDETAHAPLIDRSTCLAPLVMAEVKLATGGDYIGWLAADAEGVRQLFLAPVDRSDQAQASTQGARPVLQWGFAYSDEHVLFTREVEGGHVHLFVISKEGGSTFDVTPDAEGATLLAGLGRQWRTHVALDYQPKGEERGLWLLDFVGKERHRMAEGGYASYLFDGNLWPVGAGGNPGDGNRIMRMQQGGEWAEVASYGLADGKVCGMVAADFSGDFLFYVDSVGRDRAVLRAIDLDSEEVTTLAEHPRADLLAFGHQIDARTRMPVSMVTSYGGLRRVLVDPANLARMKGADQPLTAPIAEDWKRLAQALPGELHFVDQDLRGQRWLVAASTGGPLTYHLYDRESGQVRRLFSQVPALDEVQLATRRAFLAVARDGRELPCQLYLPPGCDEDGDGRPDQPLPTVVFVHGGPWSVAARDDWNTTRHLQLLASRGYAVLAAEFRGAAGYGRTWVDEGDGQLGSGMIDDVVDATRAVVKAGVAKPDALGVFGWSYGGYAVLRVMTREPDLFACGLAMSSIGDLHALQVARQDQPVWRALWNRRVGDPSTEEGARRLKAQSPLQAVEALNAPLLMTHGGLDLVVPKGQSDGFARAAHRAGKAVTYLVYGTEPHDYRRPASWISWWAVGERFLAAHLGGEYQPFGDDLKGVDLVIAVGAERVPGLVEAAK